MPYVIRVSGKNSPEIIEHDPSVDVWKWFDNYCLQSDPSKTIELLEDGNEIQMVAPY